GCLRERNSNHEFATLTETLTRNVDISAVHFHKPLRQRQPDAQAAFRLANGTADLSEHLKNLRQHLRSNTNPGVLHSNNSVHSRCASLEHLLRVPLARLSARSFPRRRRACCT